MINRRKQGNLTQQPTRLLILNTKYKQEKRECAAQKLLMLWINQAKKFVNKSFYLESKIQNRKLLKMSCGCQTSMAHIAYSKLQQAQGKKPCNVNYTQFDCHSSFTAILKFVGKKAT